MPVETVKRYTRENLRARPETLFVFGDNMARLGHGGQARACRGEPNAVGIPTKWRPATDHAAFFSNDDIDKVKPEIDRAFARLSAHLQAGGTVVIPEDGVGTGLARLPDAAPVIYRYITQEFGKLQRLQTA